MRFSQLPLVVQRAIKGIYGAEDAVEFNLLESVMDEIGVAPQIVPLPGHQLTAEEVTANTDAKWGRRVAVELVGFNGQSILQQIGNVQMGGQHNVTHCYQVLFLESGSMYYFREDGSTFMAPRNSESL